MSIPPDAIHRALTLLRKAGAEDLDHPGGTLLAHLQRVRARLAAWGARPELQLAGLCHAFYGTDGFPTALLPLDRRAELGVAIGPDAESLVYFYASCDRDASYPGLADPEAPFRDRFTGTTHVPSPQQRRDFAELTAANEIDLAALGAAFREQFGPGLLALFTRFRPLLSHPAWQSCVDTLDAPGGE